jgi:oligopeptide/dipeptide ABC transporter ATP-binding protein
MDAEPPLLEVAGLRVGYGGRLAVDGLDLVIRAGEVVGLLGESGCGKSTAAYALLGLARPPGRILGGAVRFAGRDVLAMDEETLRRTRGRDIGLIVQNPRAALNPILRVGAQVATVWRAHNTGGARAARERAIEMLRLVGINDPERRADAFAHELSGGMAQRVLIAIALSSAPRLLIADEPTSGLDVTIQAQFLDQMWETTRRTGSAVLLVTQEPGIVANYCDRALVMRDGRIVEDVPTRRLFAAPGSAYSRELLATSERSVMPPAPGAGASLIEVRSLARTFAVRGTTKRVQAIQDVSFAIGRGETLGLVGESGSGKTTVGRCLLRLLEPDSGVVAYRGQSLGELARTAMRRLRGRLQIVLQDPYDSLNPRWTVGRSLREPLDLHTDLSAAAKRDRVAELLRLVDLPAETAARRPRDLGGGALQRACIARALASQPDFIVLDEPTSVLAPSVRGELVRLLRRLQQELGVSYLFISHDLTTVRDVCHRVAVMYLSQIVELGRTEQIFTAPRHPYSRALLASHLFPDPTRRRVDRPRVERLSGEIPSPIDLPVGCYLVGRCPHAVAACAERRQVLTERPDGGAVRCWRAVAGEIDAETQPVLCA